ncbi:MAG: glutamine--fructose-6-phosphate transaminase (isomerizing) [Clostridiales bacterium]|nr:glutamine--fructose-6-phosphate transaminase (isomerizing) [Clostridiales bacterium]
MCGIVGYIGNQNATPILFNGLKRLEYRGYDSAGIATIDSNGISIKKSEGRLCNLIQIASSECGNIGIGHTRWATHGCPDAKNAHPHLSQSGAFAIVHNGIIENYAELKSFLSIRGFTFVSDTDSEVIAHLLDYYYDGDVIEAILATSSRLVGSYALGIICRDDHRLFAIKKDSPLVVGLSKSEAYIASDMQALTDKTRDFYILDSGEIAIISIVGGLPKIRVMNTRGKTIQKDTYRAEAEGETADKGDYPHFMLKEIYEQPAAIERTLKAQLNAPLPFLSNIGGMHIIGCGSAYHAALMGKYVIEALTGMRVNADIASEFRYRNPRLQSSDLLLAISQSGETADTIGACLVAQNKCKTACIVNVPESSLTHIASPMYTYAGSEVAVATTKGFTTQLLNLYVITLRLLQKRGDIRAKLLQDELTALPFAIAKALELEGQIKNLSPIVASHETAYFIGRGADYASAKESALKLKEISYIHADCYPAGELKHGTISLIEKGSVVVAIATDQALLDKTVSNIIEVKARGAFVIGISCFDISHVCDKLISIPQAQYTSPILASVAAQLLAYHVALARGCDIDKPRNLAKSVTVE